MRPESGNSGIRNHRDRAGNPGSVGMARFGNARLISSKGLQNEIVAVGYYYPFYGGFPESHSEFRAPGMD